TKISEFGPALFRGDNKNMEMIGHENRRHDLSRSQLGRRETKCMECLLICKDGFAIRHAVRDKIDDRLVPTQPYRKARRMSHLINWFGRRSACQTITISPTSKLLRHPLILRNCRQALRCRLIVLVSFNIKKGESRRAVTHGKIERRVGRKFSMTSCLSDLANAIGRLL